MNRKVERGKKCDKWTENVGSCGVGVSFLAAIFVLIGQCGVWLYSGKWTELPLLLPLRWLYEFSGVDAKWPHSWPYEATTWQGAAEVAKWIVAVAAWLGDTHVSFWIVLLGGAAAWALSEVFSAICDTVYG
tara:strand:+ start:1335 stop:1727 length:393 start_codon:yes stop_codon:yes gene_type:complete